MKKSNLLKAIMASSLLLLASCGNNIDSQNPSSDKNSQTSNDTTNTNAKVKVGVGYDVDFTFSADSGSAEIKVTSAFTAFDTTSNKVVANRIDVSQFNVVANAASDGVELKAKTAIRDDGYVKTKLELGADYGMLEYGHSIAEFDVQLESYASWTVGKTVEEIIAEANSEELKASCTVGTTQFSNAISNAYSHLSSVEYTNVATNKAGIAMNAIVNGKNEITVDVAGALVDSENKVVAASIDSIVINTKVENNVISVDTTQKYHNGSTETKINYLSKKTLGYDYGMKKFGSALEWFEQIASLENTAVGKTAVEVGNLVSDDNSDNANIVAGASINITSYVAALKRAVEYSNTKPIGPQH